MALGRSSGGTLGQDTTPRYFGYAGVVGIRNTRVRGAHCRSPAPREEQLSCSAQ